jgi:hypothetical protein
VPSGEKTLTGKVIKVDPSYDRTGGHGWERLYSEWISGSDENVRRAARASGYEPR